jgi:hypothetical protein
MIEDMREYGFDRDTSIVTDLSLMCEDNDDDWHWDDEPETETEPIGRWETPEPIGRWETPEPIGRWETSNVIDMASMFRGAESFNQPIVGWGNTIRNLFPYLITSRIPAIDDDDDDEAMRLYLRGLHDTTPELKGSYALPAHALPYTGRFLMDVNFLPIAECDCIPIAEAYYESELQSPTDRQVAFGAKILATFEDDGIDDRDSMYEYSLLVASRLRNLDLIEEGSVISLGHVSYQA